MFIWSAVRREVVKDNSGPSSRSSRFIFLHVFFTVNVVAPRLARGRQSGRALGSRLHLDRHLFLSLRCGDWPDTHYQYGVWFVLSRPLTPAVHSNRTTVVPLRRVELDRFFLIVSVTLSNVGVYPSGERSLLRVEDDPQKRDCYTQ